MAPTNYLKLAPGHDNTEDLLGFPEFGAALTTPVDGLFRNHWTPLVEWYDEEAIVLNGNRTPVQIGKPYCLITLYYVKPGEYDALVETFGYGRSAVTIVVYNRTTAAWTTYNGYLALVRPTEGQWDGLTYRTLRLPVEELTEVAS